MCSEVHPGGIKYRGYYYHFPRKVIGVCLVLQFVFALAGLFLLIFPYARTCLNSSSLLYLYPQGLTAISGVTGLTAVLFVWLIQRSAEKECGINTSELYQWLAPHYIVCFILFAATTLCTIYLGNIPNSDDDYIWPIFSFSLSTFMALISMYVLSQYFIFRSSPRRKVAHCYLDHCIFEKSDHSHKKEYYLNLLWDDMPSCLESGDFSAATHIIDVTIDYEKSMYADLTSSADIRFPKLDLCSEKAKRAQIWSFAWDRMLYRISPITAGLLLQWEYQNVTIQYKSDNSISPRALAWFLKITDLCRGSNLRYMDALMVFLDHLAVDSEANPIFSGKLLSQLATAMACVETFEDRVNPPKRPLRKIHNRLRRKLERISSLPEIPPLSLEELDEVMETTFYIYAASHYWTIIDVVENETHVDATRMQFRKLPNADRQNDHSPENRLPDDFYEDSNQSVGVTV